MRRLADIAARLRQRLDGQLLCLLAAALLLLITLGYPSAILQRDVFRFVFVFDITQSMNVVDLIHEDAPVSRLEFAKRAVRESLQRLPCHSEAGLAVFAEHRTFLLFAPVEVCGNFSAISTMLDRISWRMAWAARSEVAKGLYSSLKVTQELGKGTRVVFLTDGHEAPPLHTEFRPRFQGTPEDTGGAIVGIGGSIPAPIPKLDDRDQPLGYWTANEVLQVDTYSLGRGANAEDALVGVDMSNLEERIESGTEHLSLLKAGHLKALAEETALHYFNAKKPKDLGDWLTGKRFANTARVLTDLRWIPGTLAVLLLALAYIRLPTRRHSEARVSSMTARIASTTTSGVRS